MHRTATGETRRLQMDLRPPMLDELGIAVILNWFCREFQKPYSAIRIEKRIAADEDRLPLALKADLYRIVQEAFNNAEDDVLTAARSCFAVRPPADFRFPKDILSRNLDGMI